MDLGIPKSSETHQMRRMLNASFLLFLAEAEFNQIHHSRISNAMVGEKALIDSLLPLSLHS